MLYLIRGLPASGKSTYARKLCELNNIQHHYEADMFFEDERYGYRFDRSKISDAHQWCQKKTKRAIDAGEDVVVANTFVVEWELEPYVMMAEKAGVDVIVVTVYGRGDNTHNVPPATIERMTKRFIHPMDMARSFPYVSSWKIEKWEHD